ncbi:hypothetical protein [Methanobacterium sp.]|uniref:hypothetical protein n=1 Tax=Methanobacterium sp. TaxID=2164 RepID=UPI003C72EA6E
MRKIEINVIIYPCIYTVQYMWAQIYGILEGFILNCIIISTIYVSMQARYD